MHRLVKKLTSQLGYLLLGASSSITAVVFVFAIFNLYPGLQGRIFGMSPAPWTQTNWNGGLASGTVTGTVTTYASQSNLNTSGTSGQFSLQQTSNWAADYLNWPKRQLFEVDNQGGALSDYGIKVSVSYQAGMKNDFSDLRFADTAGTVFDYWIAEKTNGVSADVWVEFASLPATSVSDLYMYYGNSGATSASEQFIGSNSAPALNCNEIYRSIQDAPSRVYVVDPDNNGTNLLDVYCDMHAESQSGWEVVLNYEHYGGLNPTVAPGSVFPQLPNDVETVADVLGLGTNGETRHVDNISQYGFSNVNAIRLFGLSSWHSRKIHYMTTNNTVINSVVSNSLAGASALKSNVTKFSDHTSFLPDVATAQTDTRPERLFGYGFPMYRGGQNHWSVAGFGTRWEVDDYPNGFQNTTIHRVYARSDTALPLPGIINVTGATIQNKYPTSGNLVSNIFDAGVPADWGVLSFSLGGSGTTVVRIRSDANSDMSGATAWGSCPTVSSGTDLSATACVSDTDRYLQYRVEMTANQANTPIFQDIAIAFASSDQIAPTINASNPVISGFVSGDWYPDEATISWDAGQDNPGGNGLVGYCIALNEANLNSSSLLDPALTAGKLNGFNDGVDNNACPYIVSGTELDLSSISGLNLIAGKEYFFSIKAVDLSGNIWTGLAEDYQDLLSFKYDNEPPEPPAYISLPSNFLSDKNVIITWPATGAGSPTDLHSGLAGLQYRIGETGTWYGDLHSGTEDINDLLVNDGSYQTDPDYDYGALQEGTNFIYFRAMDNVGNVTLEDDYITGLLKINTIAPAPVRNLEVTPEANDVNSYSFDWDEPDSFTGQAGGITYCYTVNRLPNSSTCTYTAPGVTELAADAYATQPGENTIYIVARDEAGNINYETYTTVSFSYDGSAPGIVTNLDISDISIKATSSWRLVLSWDPPSDIGAGVSYYDLYRSDVSATCSAGLSEGGFSKVGSSNSSSYIDPDLEQREYFYCIKACDNANNCSAVSATVSETPTGKFTEPAPLVSAPEVLDVTTRRALIVWYTERDSDSRIQFGTESGEYFEEEISNSLQTMAHTITLNNLQPDTTYYYRARWVDEDGNVGVSEEKTFATLPPPLIISESSGNITTNSTAISFTVSNASRVDLLYGPTQAYGGVESVATSLSESSYRITLDNLTDDTLYNYRFDLYDNEGNNYASVENNQFRTLPLPQIIDLELQEIANSAQPTVTTYWTTNVLTRGSIKFYPVNNPDLDRDIVVEEYAEEHQVELLGLSTNTAYQLVITAQDLLGNTTESQVYQFTTAADSRPPEISNIKIDTRQTETVSELTGEATTQLIVSWDTDEPAIGQVEYGEGTVGVYSQRSQSGNEAGFNHVIVITNLRPASVYHLRIIARDSAGNESRSKNIVTITAEVQENSLELILGRLGDIFSFLN